ncbi:MAG: hypothetical protein ABR898_10935 [Terracidiphilus sp.]
MPESGLARLPASRGQQWLQALILVLLYSVPAIAGLHQAFVSDPDIWWHLRTGEWILQHRGLPPSGRDPFSSLGAGDTWASYSWLFELLVLQFFQRLGLVGIVAYTTGMVLAITVALHRLIRRLQADFSLAVLLTAAAAYTIYSLYTPRPWLFTILFFVLEIDILMQARRSGRMRELLWLPVIFALWVNVHIQFVDGMVVLAIAVAEAVLAQRWTGIRTRMRPAWMCGIFAACVLATLVNPYGWTIYRIAYDLAAQAGVLSKVSEFQALPFRSFDDWCVLLFALSAVAVLARARRFEFFESVLLAFAAFVSFRTQRDIWVLVIAASAILAAGLKGDKENRFQVRAFAAPLIAVVTGLIVFLGFRFQHVDDAHLRVRLAEGLPVRAVEVVKEKGWSGPLYNDFNWGGYLIWSLRIPVVIDGRAALYGDERIARSVVTWSGQPDWASDPDLVKAGLVIGPVKAPLTQLLRMDPRFELAYEDKLAAVFIARKAQPSGSEAVAAAGAGTSARTAGK